ncbi:LysR family transcriptional regulator [Pontixanthobacter aestiaquae]|uniref:LysR family transcriptional regulator n=1 Tax=Pontixanthobacter aestiaquae TaxID=1509367 RepID=A0A844ZA20_9SPHN|nr:LysR family transcriptional regulator [Pontixanthobacter aestiaquae]MDN3646290.1 LysR family transcriptional regulator [Pontixanthobacter aestiaquae]MXO82719.1 LysR family transcriptional regulator [Pontixanthobacter aestiaquae]
MRLRQIEIFYHVYRTGSISGAARELNVSQPSVSKVLRHAEDQLGFDLFRRIKGRLIATAAADELFQEAEDIYGRLASFNRALENMRERKDGHLRVGVLPSLSLSVGPELAALLSSGPIGSSVELTTLHSDEIAGALAENRADFCIGFEPIARHGVESRPVGTGGFVLVSSNSLTTDTKHIDLSLVHETAYVGLTESGPLAAIVSRALDDREIKPNKVVTTHTYHVALAMVRKGAGLAVTDQFTAYSQLGAGLHRYPLDDLPAFTIYAGYCKDHPDQQLLERAIGALEGVLNDLAKGIAAIQHNAP